MKEHLTVRASWLLGVVCACEARGVKAATLLQGMGICKSDLTGENTKVDLESAYKLWARAEHYVKDPCFGVHLGAKAHPTALGPIGLLIQVCHSVEQSLQQLHRYSYSITNLGRFQFETNTDVCTLRLQSWTESAMPVRISMSAAFAVIVKLLRLQTNNIGLTAVHLSFEEPEDVRVYSDYFACPVYFGADHNALRFDRSVIQRRLETGDRELVRVLENQIVDELARQQRVDFSAQVYAKLCELLPRGTASQGKIAHQLHMSVRKLQQQLKQENTCYKKITDSVRQALVSEYLRDGRLTVGEIACRVGFANASNFCRTFKRWYGVSPTEFRRTTTMSQTPELH